MKLIKINNKLVLHQNGLCLSQIQGYFLNNDVKSN